MSLESSGWQLFDRWADSQAQITTEKLADFCRQLSDRHLEEVFNTAQGAFHSYAGSVPDPDYTVMMKLCFMAAASALVTHKHQENPLMATSPKSGRTARISLQKRGQVVAMAQSGMKHTEIAKELGMHRNSVRKIVGDHQLRPMSEYDSIRRLAEWQATANLGQIASRISPELMTWPTDLLKELLHVTFNYLVSVATRTLYPEETTSCVQLLLVTTVVLAERRRSPPPKKCTPKTGTRRPLSADEKQLIRFLDGRGVSQTNIAVGLGRNRKTVAKYLKSEEYRRAIQPRDFGQ